MSDPTFTRKVDGNGCIRVGDELRDLLNVAEGDYVKITVEDVYGTGDP